MGFARTVRERLGAEAELEAALDTALTVARTARPQLAVDEAAFADHVARSLDGDLARAAQLELADLYLAFACAHADPAALAAFDRELLPPVRGALVKAGVPAGELDETLQRVRTELLVATPERGPRILTYEARGSLAGWLRSVGVRIGLRLKAGTAKHDELTPEHGGLTADPELEYMKKHYGEVFHRAFKVALAELPAQDRLLLKQRFRHHLGVEALGLHHGVHAATITRWVQSARDALASLVRTGMMRELGIGSADLASILRLIHSQIDVTLSTVDD